MEAEELLRVWIAGHSDRVLDGGIQWRVVEGLPGNSPRVGSVERVDCARVGWRRDDADVVQAVRVADGAVQEEIVGPLGREQLHNRRVVAYDGGIVDLGLASDSSKLLIRLPRGAVEDEVGRADGGGEDGGFATDLIGIVSEMLAQQTEEQDAVRTRRRASVGYARVR